MIKETYTCLISLQVISLILHTALILVVKVASPHPNRHALENSFVLFRNLWHLRISK
jgi:hypothetical protein